MPVPALVSIVINNHDYARYVGQAVDSALAQDWPHVEVVVVDDGSTDDSLVVLRAYGERITLVCQANGGQTSAVNAGVARSRGEVVILLDSDDVLLPGAARLHATVLADPMISRSQGRMLVVDAAGAPTGGVLPERPLPTGDLRELVQHRGTGAYVSLPMSGNAWSRRLLEAVLPLPVVHSHGGAADNFLMDTAPLYGEVRASDEPVVHYRRHDGNLSRSKDLRAGPEVARVLHGLHVARQAFLAPHAYPGRDVTQVVAAWEQRNWRTQTLAVLAQPWPQVPVPPWRTHLYACVCRPSRVKGVGIALVVCLVRLLPPQPARALAQRVMPPDEL